MYTNPVNYSVNQTFQAKPVFVKRPRLIPRAEYKEPILKLTKNDEKKINLLQNEIVNLELEHLSLAEYYSHNADAMLRRDNYDNAFFKIKAQIDSLKDEIENIKYNRHQEQIVKLAN